MAPRLDDAPFGPTPGDPQATGENPVAVGSAALCVLGAGTTALATAAGMGTVAGVSLGVAALGIAGVAYGLGSPRTALESAVVVGGVAAAVVSVVAAALTGSAPTEGVWTVTYVAGLAVALIGGVLLPVGPGRRPVGRARTAGRGESLRGRERPTVAIEPATDGDWTWRITGSEGSVLANAPRTYDSAGDARRAAHELADALDGVDPRTTTDTGSRRGSEPGAGDGSSGETSPTPPPVRKRSSDADPTDEPTDPPSPDPSRRVGGVVDADAVETAVFVLEPAGDGWGWRLRYEGRTVVAEAPEPYPTRAAARSAVERVRVEAGDAGVLTYDPAAFEVFESEDDRKWHWRLRSDGEVLAVSTSGYDTRSDAMTIVQGVLEAAGDGPTVRRDDDGVRWVLSVEDAPVATAPDAAESETAARAAFDRVGTAVEDAGVLVLDPAGFAVEPTAGDTWNWRLRHADGTVLAAGPGHTDRDRAVEGLRTVQRVAPHADVEVDDTDTARMIEEALSDAAEARHMAERIGRRTEEDDSRDEDSKGNAHPEDEETGNADGGDVDAPRSDEERADSPRFEVLDFDRVDPDGREAKTPDAGASSTGWGWRLVHERTVAAVVDGFPDRGSAVADAGEVAGRLTEATAVRVDPAAVEVCHGEGWHWRLVTGEGVLAASTAGFDRARDARRAASRTVAAARENGGDVEVYREEGWRWRYRTDDGVVASATVDFETPAAARDAARRLSEYAGDPPFVECSTATREVFRVGGSGSWTWRLRGSGGRVLVAAERRWDDPAAVEASLTALGDGLAAANGPVVRDGTTDADGDSG